MCAAMRKTLSTWVVALALLGATNALATASFANRSLGLGLSGFALLGDTRAGIDWGLPITLEGGIYLDNGFEAYLRIPFLLAYQKVGVLADGSGGVVIGTGGNLGLRYLFLQESIRPYVFLEFAGLYYFRPDTGAYANNFFLGPGAGVGVDFFVTDSVSLGARGYTDLFITLNPTLLTFAVGGGINFTTYF